MKIDCPHCGVQGSIDNALVNKKLRCPKCSKVFLITEDILPELDNAGMLSQEILYDDEHNSPDLPEEDDDLLAAMGDGSLDDDGEASADEDEPGLMVDEGEDSDLDIMSDNELEEDDFELENCSGCGELLHPDFLETVGADRLCALCVPEEDSEAEADIDLLIAEGEEVHIQQEEQSIEIEDDSSVQILLNDDTADEAEEVVEATEEGEELEEGSDNDGIALAGAGAVAAAGAVMATGDDDEKMNEEESADDGDFTVGNLIKEAWRKTKGAKASVWGGVIAMSLLICGVVFGGMAGFQEFYKGSDPNIAMGATGAVQLVANWLSMLMTGGIMLIGVRHVLEQRVSWKMAFTGFSKAFSITMALILQTILILIGFLLLVIPGIYLSVGYALVLPLILDKGMGPWEALEASRKAIHKKWWTVFGLYLVMMLIYIVSIIPLGLGLIWTIPMFFVMTGVIYVRLFGSSDAIKEEDSDEELEDGVNDALEEETEEESEKSEEVEEKLEEISEEAESRQ